MVPAKLSPRIDGLEHKAQAWFCTTGLPSDIVVEVKEMSFHLHKFPLISKSGRIGSLIAETYDDEDGRCTIKLSDFPGGIETFELAAKFCYGAKLELTPDNVVALRCAAEYLEMTDEYEKENLITKTENYFNQVIFRSWKDSVRALQRCESVLLHAEELQIVNKCIDSIVTKTCTDPSLFGWPITDQRASMRSPERRILWYTINTGAASTDSRSGRWWYEDVAAISLPFLEKIILTMQAKGLRPEMIAGAVTHYARKRLPGLSRRNNVSKTKSWSTYFSLASIPPNLDQRLLLETLENLLPKQKGVTSVRLLFGFLRLAMILNASADCKRRLEMRISAQLEQATLDDLLIPNYSDSLETLYDIETVQRILDHFLILYWRQHSPSSLHPSEDPPAMDSLMRIASLVDVYLAEIAPDANLKPETFQTLAETLPDFSRVLDDQLYRAIDLYLKAHPWLTEHERDEVCKVLDRHKLSRQASTHAAQNESLPLHVVIDILFFEQLQLRTAIKGCFLASDNANFARQTPSPVESEALLRGTATPPRENGWAQALQKNQAMKMDMDQMRVKLNALEGECAEMRKQLQTLGKGKIRKIPRMLLKNSDCSSLSVQVHNTSKKQTNDHNTNMFCSPKIRKLSFT